MTTNERIALWLGWRKIDSPQDAFCWKCDGGGLQDRPPQFDADITFWHGADGLLAEIERRGRLAGAGGLLFALHEQYRAALPRECGLTGPVAAVGWEKFLLKATPAQLAAALVKMIEGENPPTRERQEDGSSANESPESLD